MTVKKSATATDDTTPSKLKATKKVSAEFNEKAEKPLFAGRILAPNGRRLHMKGKRFIITAAQNNTEVHPGFLKALEAYAKDQDAQIIVAPFTYNNGATAKGEGPVWDPKIEKYLVHEPVEISKKLVVGAELDITPTSTNPLSGFDNYFQGASGIIPSPQVALKSLPGLGDDNSRFLYSTGAITERNYAQKKAGQKAEFHHNYGALVVEVDDAGNFFVRQLAADHTGMFQDLTNKYMPDGKILRDQPVEAVTLGDIHVEKLDPVQDEVSFGKGGILETLKPKYLFLHDLMDFTARNHHNIKDPFFWAQQKELGNTVEGGFKLVAEWLKAHAREGREDVIVESNHNEAFGKWLREADARFDPENARFWHEASAEMMKRIEKGDTDPNIFEWAVRRYAELKEAKFLRENDTFITAKDEDGRGIENSMHGHSGPNGARGSPKGFTQMDQKVNTAHTHAAGIIDGVYTAGVSGKLDMGYNKGPSSWNHSHIITYPNGKRAIITTHGGKWKADDKKHVPTAATLSIPKDSAKLQVRSPGG